MISGFEKFWNLKCRLSGLKPDAVVIVATIRDYKCTAEAPRLSRGYLFAMPYTKENIPLVEAGCENLVAHINIVRKSGLTPVVSINSFPTDTNDEVKVVRRISQEHGGMWRWPILWLKGGEGALELAEAVSDSCAQKKEFRFLYNENTTLSQRIELIAKEVYGASGVEYTPDE